MMKSAAFPRILLLAAVLMLPAPPARADIIADFLKTVVGPLSSVIGGLNALQGLLVQIEMRLPVMMKTIEMKEREKLANALATNQKQAVRSQADIEAVRENAGDYASARCMQVTGGQDIALKDNVQDKLAAVVRQDVQSYSTTGLPPGGSPAFSREKASVQEIPRGLSEYQKHLCLFGTKHEIAAQKLRCPASATPGASNPAAGADTTAPTLLSTNAFNDDTHFVASMSFCYALTGNSAIPYAQGRNLTDHIENIHQFNAAMGDYATKSLGQYFCFNPIARKLPIDNKFVQTHAEFQRQLDQFASFEGTSGRSPAAIDLAARAYLLSPDAGGYVEVGPTDKVTGEPSLAAQHKLIKGQMVSGEQVDEAEYFYKWYAKVTTNKTQGDKNFNLGNMYTARLYKTQLLWRQYEETEHELLLEATALARMTHDQMGNPQVEDIR